MSQGNCTLCKHSHMQEQLGEMQRLCTMGPPTVVALPQRTGMFMASVWPAVSDKMVCDAFAMAEGSAAPRLAFGRTIDS